MGIKYTEEIVDVEHVTFKAITIDGSEYVFKRKGRAYCYQCLGDWYKKVDKASDMVRGILGSDVIEVDENTFIKTKNVVSLSIIQNKERLYCITKRVATFLGMTADVEYHAFRIKGVK